MVTHIPEEPKMNHRQNTKLQERDFCEHPAIQSSRHERSSSRRGRSWSHGSASGSSRRSSAECHEKRASRPRHSPRSRERVHDAKRFPTQLNGSRTPSMSSSSHASYHISLSRKSSAGCIEKRIFELKHPSRPREKVQNAQRLSRTASSLSHVKTSKSFSEGSFNHYQRSRSYGSVSGLSRRSSAESLRPSKSSERVQCERRFSGKSSCSYSRSVSSPSSSGPDLDALASILDNLSPKSRSRSMPSPSSSGPDLDALVSILDNRSPKSRSASHSSLQKRAFHRHASDSTKHCDVESRVSDILDKISSLQDQHNNKPNHQQNSYSSCDSSRLSSGNDSLLHPPKEWTEKKDQSNSSVNTASSREEFGNTEDLMLTRPVAEVVACELCLALVV